MIPTARLALIATQLLVVWTLLTSLGGRGDPWPVVGAVALALGAYLAGSLLPRPILPWAAAAVGAAACLAVLLADGPMTDPLSGPLGYANADAALVVQGAAALAVAAWSGPAWLRLPAGVGIVAAALLCLEIGAHAATGGVLLVLFALLTVDQAEGRRVSIAVSLAALIGGCAVAFLVGAGVAPGAAGQVLSERRVELWSQGMQSLGSSPFAGLGAGEFHRGAAAADDPDTSNAHAELLQRAVENGLPGAALELTAVLAVAWTLIGRGDRAAACALAGWAAVWANAGIDWILGFPALLATAAFVAGLGSGRLDVAPVSPGTIPVRPLAHGR